MIIYQFILILATLAQQLLVPISYECKPQCSKMRPSDSTTLIFKYENPLSKKAPFPYLSLLRIIAVDDQNREQSKRVYQWTRNKTNQEVEFRPKDWANNTSSIGIKIQWEEKFFDETPGGLGEQIVGLIEINESKTSQDKPSETLVIGTNSAIFHGISLSILLFVLLIN